MSTKTYYTEYPTGEFQAKTDVEALSRTGVRVVYRESESSDGRPFVILREHHTKRCKSVN